MGSNKIKVVVFADWFTPGYKAGGPIRSVSNFVDKMSPFFDFWVITRNTDLGEVEGYPGIQANVWLEKEFGHVIYLDNQSINKSKLKELLEAVNPEWIYLNSLFSSKFAILPLLINKKLKKKVLLAPRGMLSSGALGLKKSKKESFSWNGKVVWFIFRCKLACNVSN